MHMNVCMSFYDQRGAVKTARLRSTQVLFQSSFQGIAAYTKHQLFIFLCNPQVMSCCPNYALL